MSHSNIAIFIGPFCERLGSDIADNLFEGTFQVGCFSRSEAYKPPAACACQLLCQLLEKQILRRHVGSSNDESGWDLSSVIKLRMSAFTHDRSWVQAPEGAKRARL